MLDRYSFFAGGDINSRLERDLFLIFDYRDKLPLLFDIGVKPELHSNCTTSAEKRILM